MKILKPIYYMILLAVVAFMGSCEQEESLNELPIEQSEELDPNIESEFLEGKRFVITDTGERISEDEYIKQIDESTYGNLGKASVVTKIPVSRPNMEALGMSFSNSRGVLNRIQTRIFAGTPINQFEVKGVLVNSRPFGNSFVCNTPACHNANQSKFVITRTDRGAISNSRIEGPFTLTQRQEKGLPNRNVSLGGTRIFDYESSTQSSITKTNSTSANFGFKYGISVSAKFFGSGTDISSEISFGAETSNSTSTTNGRTITKRDVINYSPGDVIPKGKKCTFRVVAEKREVTRRYRVKTRIEANMVIRVKRSWGSDKIVFNHGEGENAYPGEFREGKVYHDFDVKSQFWSYSIVRENCRNL